MRWFLGPYKLNRLGVLPDDLSHVFHLEDALSRPPRSSSLRKSMSQKG